MSTAVDESDVICCGMTVTRISMIRASLWKMKALTVKVETVTLMGKGT
jgi:hypothetical protein